MENRATNFFAKWFWSIDRVAFVMLVAILFVGSLLITAASPAVAERIKLSSFYFVYRQLLFLAVGLFLIFIISLLNEKALKRMILLGFITFTILMVAVLLFGEEAKGARRWINILGFTMQPSEFLKPFFITLIGLILSEKYSKTNFPGFTIALGIHFVVCCLLILQPDFGMVITYTAVLCGQFFLAGISLWLIIMLGIVAVLGAVGAYTFLPHVAKRVDSFLNPTSENYQVERSLEAYINGGLFGKGPGEGTVKSHLPDSHSDFIFAVAGEEFGAIFCAIIIILFFAFSLRSLVQILKSENLFEIFTCSGIMMLFILQTIFNIGVTLHLFPTKGMTLPFISYGGSSVLSFAIAFGIFFNLTRRRITYARRNDKFYLNKPVVQNDNMED